MEDVGAVMDAAGSVAGHADRARPCRADGADVRGDASGSRRLARDHQRLRALLARRRLSGRDAAEAAGGAAHTIEADVGNGHARPCRSARRSPGSPGDRGLVRAGRALRGEPGTAIAKMRAVFELDVRNVLPLVGAPTLVVHEPRRQVRARRARPLPRGAPADARLLERDSPDHWPLPEPDLMRRDRGVRHRHAAARRATPTACWRRSSSWTSSARPSGDRARRPALARAARTLRGDRPSGHSVAHRGELVNTAGDGVLATFDGPARAIRCAATSATPCGRSGLDVRCGLHTGEVTRRNGDVAGIAVHIGARVSAAASPGEVLVTRTVRDLVAGSGIAFDERGEHSLKGVPEAGRSTRRAAERR